MGKLAGLGVALLLFTACDRQPGAGVAGGPVASALRSASPPGATPSAEPLAVGLQAQCRLPVYWRDSNGSAQNRAGFVTFPSGQLVEEATAPTGQDSAPYFYDRALAKWIFALRDQVSPDGREYAYGEPWSGAAVPGKLHVVDIATGVDRVIDNSPVVPSVVQFTADGIYFTHNFGEGMEVGLWLIAPQGGQPKLVSSTIWEPRVANGAAWGLAFNAADPDPAPGGITHPYNTILRFDLNTGSSVVWWYQPGSDMRLTRWRLLRPPLCLHVSGTGRWLSSRLDARHSRHRAPDRVGQPRVPGSGRRQRGLVRRRRPIADSVALH